MAAGSVVDGAVVVDGVAGQVAETADSLVGAPAADNYIG